MIDKANKCTKEQGLENLKPKRHTKCKKDRGKGKIIYLTVLFQWKATIVVGQIVKEEEEEDVRTHLYCLDLVNVFYENQLMTYALMWDI